MLDEGFPRWVATREGERKMGERQGRRETWSPVSETRNSMTSGEIEIKGGAGNG